MYWGRVPVYSNLRCMSLYKRFALFMVRRKLGAKGGPEVGGAKATWHALLSTVIAGGRTRRYRPRGVVKAKQNDLCRSSKHATCIHPTELQDESGSSRSCDTDAVREATWNRLGQGDAQFRPASVDLGEQRPCPRGLRGHSCLPRSAQLAATQVQVPGLVSGHRGKGRNFNWVKPSPIVPCHARGDRVVRKPPAQERHGA